MGQDSSEENVISRSPPKGVAAMKPQKKLAPEDIAAIEEVTQQGFTYTKTDMAVETYDQNFQSLGGDWVECGKGIPEFVFKWTEEGSALRADCIHSWYKWNKGKRTLQREVKGAYWIMSMWKSRMNNVWIIERWTRDNGPRYGPTIHYVREGLDEPCDNDTWYACNKTWGIPGYNPERYDDVTYTFPENEICSLKVKGFPTAGAIVKGSGNKAIEHQGPSSPMKRIAAKIKGTFGFGN